MSSTQVKPVLAKQEHVGRSHSCASTGVTRGKQKQCRMRAEMCLEFYGYGGDEADQSVRILGCKHTRVVTVWVDQLSLSCAGSDARR